MQPYLLVHIWYTVVYCIGAILVFISALRHFSQHLLKEIESVLWRWGEECDCIWFNAHGGEKDDVVRDLRNSTHLFGMLVIKQHRMEQCGDVNVTCIVS